MFFNLLSNCVSALLGFTFLLAFFLLSLVIVVGSKILILKMKEKFHLTPPPKIEPQTKTNPTKKRKTYRTIEINPDEVDRVFFKKLP